MKKILITGGSGFIGSHVSDAFLKRGYKVIIIDKALTRNVKNVYPNVSFYKVDLNDPQPIREIIKQEKPHIISHHASELVGVRESTMNPQKAFRDIVLTSNLFEAAKNTTVKRIIFSSSANVYDKKSTVPISELAPVNPVSPYGIAKLAIETYCSYLEQIWAMKFTIFRYFNVYGPRQRLTKHAGIIPLLINKILKNREVIIYGTGEQSRDFIYVKDIAHANVLASEKNISGIFNVGTMQELSINELIRLIEKMLNKKVKRKYQSNFDEIERSLADNSKIKKLLQWHPETSFTDGLKETINYYKDVWKKKS